MRHYRSPVATRSVNAANTATATVAAAAQLQRVPVIREALHTLNGRIHKRWQLHITGRCTIGAAHQMFRYGNANFRRTASCRCDRELRQGVAHFAGGCTMAGAHRVVVAAAAVTAVVIVLRSAEMKFFNF